MKKLMLSAIAVVLSAYSFAGSNWDLYIHGGVGYSNMQVYVESRRGVEYSASMTAINSKTNFGLGIGYSEGRYEECPRDTEIPCSGNPFFRGFDVYGAYIKNFGKFSADMNAGVSIQHLDVAKLYWSTFPYKGVGVCAKAQIGLYYNVSDRFAIGAAPSIILPMGKHGVRSGTTNSFPIKMRFRI
jgi:hypothetical protein